MRADKKSILLIFCIVIISAFSSGCAGRVPPEKTMATETPTVAPSPPAPSPDTTPPPPITGLIAWDAYDGRVALRWDKSTVEDFASYNIYVSRSEITNVIGLTPVHLRDISANTYLMDGLENDAKYYFAVTAVDKRGNENPVVRSASATPTAMPRGTLDPEIYVDIYRPDRAWAGTTLLGDNHNPERPRIIEVNMRGEIVWEYRVPGNLRGFTNPGFDVERLSSNNILFVLPRKGVYEINRKGKVLWSYLDRKVSHDADRLLNGDTMVVFGAEDQMSDAQVKEVNPKGEIVWAWYAKDYFNKAPFLHIYDQGWTHINAAERLRNGNTLISLRNFNFLVEVDPHGSIVRTIGEGILKRQHDPEVLLNGNILLANHREPHSAVEINPQTGRIVWEYTMSDRRTWPVRDANRLPNGNTLITAATKILEVTQGGEVVWQLTLKGVNIKKGEGARRGFYKAERINPQYDN
jgi:hypothetical protein